MTDSTTEKTATSHRTTAGSRPEGPGRRERLRAGVARRIVRVRQDARRYRRLSAILSVVAALALTLAGVSLAADGGPEAVPLGHGVAGVEDVDPGVPSGEDVVHVPEARTPPAPPEDAAAGEALGEGSASYYHDTLEGRATASGEPYRGAALTAAHRSLPFGSKVRVTNPANGRSVVVRINDRGPFAAGRVIDLSRSAARQVGLLERGHGRVRLELME